MSMRLLLLLAVASIPYVAHAQIIRSPTSSSGSDAGAGSAEETGKQAQGEFERFRHLHLPSATESVPGHCDETVGRFCYWYNEHPAPMPKEPVAITDRRNNLLALLDSLAKVAPDDRWVVAQRVRYLAEAERFGDALTAARECRVGGWWCDMLVGFSLHMLGEYASADSVYNVALDKMLPRDRCAWRDISLLIDDDTRQQYGRSACGDAAHKAFEDRVWFFARTTYSLKGNDSRTEHFARMTMALMMSDAPGAYQFGFDDDERELLLRFGWPRAWATERNRTPGQDPVSVIGSEPIPAYRYIPAGFVLNDPSLSDSTNWALQLPPVIGRYAPPYAKSLTMLVHQKAMFKRDDSAYVVLAYDVRGSKEVSGAKINAALVVSPSEHPHSFMTYLRDAPPVGVLTTRAPWGPLLMSAEVMAPSRAAVVRARYGVNPPFAVGTRVTLSDLLFYKPYGTFPTTAEEAAPHALTTERVIASEKLGVYWESYGTDPTGEKMKVSLTVVKEVEESGFFRRQAKALKLVREATPVSITVEDLSARGSTTSPRAIDLDITTLKKGSYIVQLEIEVAGQYVVRTDHRIEIIGP